MYGAQIWVHLPHRNAEMQAWGSVYEMDSSDMPRADTSPPSMITFLAPSLRISGADINPVEKEHLILRF